MNAGRFRCVFFLGGFVGFVRFGQRVPIANANQSTRRDFDSQIFLGTNIPLHDETKHLIAGNCPGQTNRDSAPGRDVLNRAGPAAPCQEMRPITVIDDQTRATMRNSA